MLVTEKHLQNINRFTPKRFGQRSNFQSISIEPTRLFGTDDVNHNEGIDTLCINKY